MAKKKQVLPSVTRVAPSSTAFVELPIGITYETINVNMTGTALAVGMVEEVRLLANGKELQVFKTLDQLIKINAFHGRATDTVADWCLYFNNDDYLTLAEKKMEGLGTQGLQTLTLEIKLGVTWPANGTIVANAAIETENMPLGVFNRVRQISLNAGGAGITEFDKLIRGGAVYKQIHLFKSDITKVELEADSVKVIDALKTVLERFQKNVKPIPRVPQSAFATHIDFCESGFYGELFDTAGMGDCRIRMTVGSAGIIDIVTEQLDVFKD